MRQKSIAAFIAILSAVTAAEAGSIRVELAPDGTTITFELEATLHTVHGTAELQRGVFEFDTATGDASGEAVAASMSADTDNRKRDKKMHAEVLRSDEHPKIVLRAKRLEGDLSLNGSSEVILVGTIQLLGASHPVRLPMKVSVTGSTATVITTFSVPYVAWGLNDPSTFILKVAKEVKVTVSATDVSIRPEPKGERSGESAPGPE